jgi:hypothetical protein
MHALLIRVLVTALTASVATILGLVPAFADTVCQQKDPLSGQCTVSAEVQDSSPSPSTASVDGPKDTGPGQSCNFDPSEQGLSEPAAGPVPCSSKYGFWSNAYNCYISPVQPPPPAGDPSWQGHKPADGAVYLCYQPQTDIDIRIWAQDPPPGSASGPTPREVAQLAIDRLNLRAVDIGITPEPGPNRVGLVGMPVWLWVKAPDSHTFGPATASATAGGTTVTATARVQQISWDMGDGTEVVCATAGMPYRASYGNRRSPDCGHVYSTSSAGQPGERFTVTATSQWVVRWAGAGQTGTIRLDGLRRSVQIAVGEAQVLVE